MEIKDLKVGDEVHFEYWGGWRDYWSKSIVERITPTGLIRVKETILGKMDIHEEEVQEVIPLMTKLQGVLMKPSKKKNSSGRWLQESTAMA